MKPEIAVRSARLGDLEALVALHAQLVDQSPQPVETSAAVLEAILAQPGRHLLVATSEDLVIGTADLVITPNLTHEARPWAIIENVLVTEGMRRCGAGALLLGTLVGLAREAGCYRIGLTSDKGEANAHAFYRALGFEAVAEGFKLYLG